MKIITSALRITTEVLVTFLAWLMFSMSASSYAEESETWNAKFQTTFVHQKKPSFDAAYSGANSLLTRSEDKSSLTATAFLGWRPFANTEFYYNPEIIRGQALSGLLGLGGITNGEN